MITGIDGVPHPILNGQVIFQVVVQADGTVGSIAVIRVEPSDYGFEEAAADAVKQWRYEPASVHGTPVDVFFTVVVDMTLHR